MADAKSVGTAYLTLVPKMSEGWEGGVKSSISGVFGTVAKSAAVVGAAKAAADVFAESFTEYANYEQLVGGVETMFKEDADLLMLYANSAYKTAGLSANQYMEQVTSFSASLLASLDGDTMEAVELADTAILDMADNANKMGSSMESIQNAYQGFAKQNYTMLDNLKLGYGGTKSEMERLLADATKIREQQGINTQLSIENFDDIIMAIHVLQNEMGITGTTSKEAENTIQGSLSMTQSAWKNLVTAFGDPAADIDAEVDAVIDSVFKLADNVIPVGLRIASGIVQGVADGIAHLGDAINKGITNGLGSVIGLTPDQMGNVYDSATDAAVIQYGGAVDYATAGVTNAAAPVTNTFIVNGVTYDDGSAAANAVQQLVEAVIVDERS